MRARLYACSFHLVSGHVMKLALLHSRLRVRLFQFHLWSLNYISYDGLWLIHSAPAHTKKRKSDQMLEKYEKVPRKLKHEEEKEVIHLLPIKDKSGLIPQTMEKPGSPYLQVGFGFVMAGNCFLF